MRQPSKARPKPPIEYSILYTATLCLIAAGAVMVYSSSSAESLLQGTGDPSYYLKRYVIYAAIGLVVMHLLSRRGLKAVKNVTGPLLVASFVLCIAAMLPGVGVTVNGATRWVGAGPVQFQPSELLKVAVVLYGAQLLATRPKRLLTLGGVCKPFLIVVGAACLLLLKQPDMGTALVICFATLCLLLASGVRMRHIGIIVGAVVLVVTILALVEPYRRARLLSFVDPWNDARYAGFRAAKAARERYAKLLAAGITSLILAQAVLNFFAVMGLAPLTGVPLPFVSYGNSNLIVLLGAMGLVLGIAKRSSAAQGRGLRSIDGGRAKDERTARADRSRRHGGPRRAGARDSRPASRQGR